MEHLYDKKESIIKSSFLTESIEARNLNDFWLLSRITYFLMN